MEFQFSRPPQHLQRSIQIHTLIWLCFEAGFTKILTLLEIAAALDLSGWQSENAFIFHAPDKRWEAKGWEWSLASYLVCQFSA